MPIGTLINCISVFLSGIIGSSIGRYVPERTRKYLTVLFGFCSVSIGINSVIKVHAMPPIIAAVILGSAIGDLCGIEKVINNLFSRILALIPAKRSKSFDMEQFITAVVLFCASGFGIYGVLLEGISGNSSILFSKAVLDLFTGSIFAITLGISVSIIAIPMSMILFSIYFLAGAIAPFVSNTILLDFMACGGVLTIAAGLRVSGIKNTPIGNMIPALVLVMPLSYVWSLLPV